MKSSESPPIVSPITSYELPYIVPSGKGAFLTISLKIAR
jgi:hypothetical protein